jgi:putative addiction module component (TIGR02574 family)
MSGLAKENILELSVSERIQLVEDNWDSIAKVSDAVRLSNDQKVELDRRLDSYRDDPTLGPPWEIVRERIRGRK